MRNDLPKVCEQSFNIMDNRLIPDLDTEIYVQSSKAAYLFFTICHVQKHLI